MGLGGPRWPGEGGASLGAPLRPCSGLRRGPRLRPAGPSSAPLRGLRAGLRRFAARAALPAWRRVGRPSLGAPPAPVGASGLRGPSWAPSGCRAPGPPVGPSLGPLRWSSVAGSAPPLRPPWSGGRWGLPGRRVPPSGACPGGSCGFGAGPPPRPASGGGPRPAAGRPVTGGPCSCPPRAENGGGVPPAADPSAYPP